MEFIIKSPNKDEVEKVRLWRNQTEGVLRTPFLLTYEMQQDFYNDVICDRKSNCRFYSVYKENFFLSFIGIVNISFENRIGEISIFTSPQYQNIGYGKELVKLLFDLGFNNLNLDNIYGECYCCNAQGIKFWEKIIEKYKGYKTMLPNRKYYKGLYFNSMYFNIERKVFNND